MLDQLIQIRNEQLNEINEFMQNNQQNSLAQLKILHKSIKQNYTAFAKGLTSVYESNLFRCKLANPLQLAQLGKYTNLMRNEVTVSLAKVEHLLVLPCIRLRFVHVLPSNQILLFCSKKKNMVVLNKSGDLIHFKAFKTEFNHDVKVNATNIVVFDSTSRNVEIYNFELELVHSIRLERSYDGLKLNNYEIALSAKSDADQFIMACYNYKTAQPKKKEICLNTDQLKRIMDFGKDEQRFWFQLVDLNDRFIFIEGYGFCKKLYGNYIFLLNRHDNNNLFKYFESRSDDFLIYNNQFGSISDFFLGVFDWDDPNYWNSIAPSIKKIYSTSNYKYIYDRNDFINMNENDFTIKFDLY